MKDDFDGIVKHFCCTHPEWVKVCTIKININNRVNATQLLERLLLLKILI